MLPFRSEIRNSPTQTTIKVFLNDTSLDHKIKNLLEYFNEIEAIEIRKTVGRNRGDENLTIFLKENADINTVKNAIDSNLSDYFEKN